MYVIVSYDVKTEKCTKLLKLLRKYLFHVHNSVFEGELTEKDKEILQKEISKIINDETSSVIFYCFPSIKVLKKTFVGFKDDLSIII